jgi:hypothetical protein
MSIPDFSVHHLKIDGGGNTLMPIPAFYAGALINLLRQEHIDDVAHHEILRIWLSAR